VLGTGNFAVVKFGVERATGKRVAIKIIDKRRFMAQAASRKDKILDEVNILKELDHPNIIRIFDVFDTEKTLYIVLELVTGGDLLEFIMEVRAIPEERARSLFLQMASALAYLHSKGIAHRDLKPENLLLLDKKHDRIKVTDFGLSKVLDEGSYTKTICGTP
jgi:serine/threonine protein kinase